MKTFLTYVVVFYAGVFAGIAVLSLFIPGKRYEEDLERDRLRKDQENEQL